MLFLIALSSCLTVTLLVIAVLNRPPDRVRARVHQLGRDDSYALGGGDQSFRARIMQPVAAGVAAQLLRFLPPHWIRRLQRLLIAAGEPLDLGLFMLIWMIHVMAGAMAGLYFFGSLGLLGGGAAGLVLPYMWLRRRASSRRLRISNSMPDTIDLLVTCVEAGLGLDAALIRVSEATEGPLGEEIAIAVRQIAVGRPRLEALLDLATRAGVQDLETFIRPIIQAEQSGVSIAATLRMQADTMRVRRRQRAQEFGQKLPIKMSVPIAVFFIPAVLIISVGPAIFSIADFMQQI